MRATHDVAGKVDVDMDVPGERERERERESGLSCVPGTKGNVSEICYFGDPSDSLKKA